jgi:hypothetical protein
MELHIKTFMKVFTIQLFLSIKTQMYDIRIFNLYFNFIKKFLINIKKVTMNFGPDFKFPIDDKQVQPVSYFII